MHSYVVYLPTTLYLELLNRIAISGRDTIHRIGSFPIRLYWYFGVSLQP